MVILWVNNTINKKQGKLTMGEGEVEKVVFEKMGKMKMKNVEKVNFVTFNTMYLMSLKKSKPFLKKSSLNFVVLDGNKLVFDDSCISDVLSEGGVVFIDDFDSFLVLFKDQLDLLKFLHKKDTFVFVNNVDEKWKPYLLHSIN